MRNLEKKEISKSKRLQMVLQILQMHTHHTIYDVTMSKAGNEVVGITFWIHPFDYDKLAKAADVMQITLMMFLFYGVKTFDSGHDYLCVKIG